MDVFQYSDYRKFLQDWLLKAKKEKKTSASQLAEVIRVHPTFLSQVLLGKKDLASDHWIGLCDYFDLTEIEKDYLNFVYLKNRAGTPTSKKFYQRKMDEILKKRLHLKERLKDHRELSDSERAIFYSSWIYSAIRLFCSVGKGQSLLNIADKFNIKKDKAEQIVEFLIQTGLCKIERDLIQMGDQHIHVSADSPFVSKHHINWRVLGIQSLDRAQTDELHFTGPMSVSKKDFLVIREKIVKLIQENIEIIKESDAEDVASLTIDFFWPAK